MRLGQLRQILHFSASMTGSGVFCYLIFQTDKLLIGRFLGDSALGLYSMAQRLLEVPISFITGADHKGSLSRFLRDRKR